MRLAVVFALFGIVFVFLGVFSFGSTMPVVLILVGLGFLAAALVRLGYILVMRTDS